MYVYCRIAATYARPLPLGGNMLAVVEPARTTPSAWDDSAFGDYLPPSRGSETRDDPERRDPDVTRHLDERRHERRNTETRLSARDRQKARCALQTVMMERRNETEQLTTKEAKDGTSPRRDRKRSTRYRR